MLRKVVVFLLASLLASSVYSLDLAEIDKRLDRGDFLDSKKELEKSFDKLNPNLKILWRIARCYYELSDRAPNKKDTILLCEQGMELLKDYVDVKEGEPIDRAKIVYWYDVLYSRRGKAIGIKESLNIIPELFKLADKAISIYPKFGDPYHLKAAIDDAVPGFLGGDKFRMSENFTKAISYDENIIFLVDAATGFLGRNWDVKKKGAMAAKFGRTDGSPENLSDKEFAKELLQKALEVGKNKDFLSINEKEKIEEAKKNLKKLN
ncbi:MAG TPA: hypothetical protein PLG34_08045 [Spirochaetota bacterium]|jgi:hypothetical protein|nr:MAG: hypothetical protein BWX91_01737 [Spirochaetes bacterium ADurb.Bin133]HNZ27756.1 hypothetical protein [Spirochaetota bacterium]HPY87918.1 hypothetical protein [Spirochaetota bacterium]